MRIAGLVLLMFMADIRACGADFYHDFRGKQVDMQVFRLIGDADEHIKYEADGVRITLPGDATFRKSVGLMSEFTIKGDFDIITSFDLLQAGRPKTGNGVGLEFYLRTDTIAQDAVRFARVARVKEGDVYMCSRMTTENGKRRTEHRFFPTTAKSGQLRLTRKNGVVTFWVTEESGVLRELSSFELGSEDVKSLWVAAYTGLTPNAVDLRIKDFRVRQLEGDAADAPFVALAVPGRRMLWLLLGLCGICLITSGVWLWRRRWRPTRPVARGKPIRRVT